MKTNSHRILSLLCLLCLPPSAAVIAQQTITGYQTIEQTYNGTKYIRQQTDYDGLGRPIKKFTTMDSSAAKPDRIQLIAYDVMGRDDSVTYLPYAGIGVYNMQQCLIDQKNFYDNSAYGNDGKYAYSLKTYDKSPQNVVTSVSAPGEYHNARSQKGHPIFLTNRLNLQSDRIKQYVIQNDSMIYFKGWYLPDCLTVEEQRMDQSPGNIVYTRTYKNSRGQIIATSVQADDEECRTTYFVYDDNYDDRLRCVIPPAVDRQIQPRDDAFAWYKFRDQIRFMEYDDRGNMIREYYPGREHTCYIYDRLHRVVLSQDGNQRPKEYWTYYRYDDLGRIFQIAQVHSYNSEQTLRSSCINTSGKYTENQLDALTRAPTLLAEYHYGGDSDYKIVVENNVQKKQHTTFTVPAYLAAANVANVFYTYNIGDNTGLKIYEKIAALPKNSGTVERAFYYDSDGRMIQSVEKNAAGGITRISNKYDFTGNLLTCHESVQASSDAEPDIKVTTCTYDDLGQLLTEKVQLNDSPEAAIAYSYDQLGHCVKTVAGDELLNTSLKYDISGNLTSQVNEVFQMQLYRERPFSSFVSPNYAGMISECRWNHRKGVSENWHSYQYAYTPYGEFQGVQLQHGPAMQTRNVEKNLTYDLNGNILTLQRTGTDGSLIADYSYHYSGNRLDSLSDAGDSVRTFSYDANGNMISDSKINCKFQYNILNLTEKVSDAGSQELLRYTWLFDGSKTRARTSDGNGYTYLGSLIYADTPAGTTLESTGFSNGRIVRTSSGYAVQYHVRDHLGSVRSIVDEEGEVVEVDDYYPFGQRWDKPAAPRTDNRYLFNGKESQTFADLPLLDYGARMYDSDLGRWPVHDPKAADYYPTSPYAFCANNPLNLIDPDGRSHRTFRYDPWFGTFVDEQGTYYTWNDMITYISFDLGYDIGIKMVGVMSGILKHFADVGLDWAAQHSNPVVNVTGLMIEFLTGWGAESRDFDETTGLTQSIKNSNMTKIALKRFYEHYTAKKESSHSVPIKFSPFGRDDTGPGREFNADGITAIQFIGSATYYFDVQEDMVNVRVYDTKTPHSLFYHVIPARYSRDSFSIMGETKQNYYFSIPLIEILQTFQ